MSKIKLTGENSGYVELSAGQNAGNNTLELPTSGTKVVASDDSNNVNNLGIVTATTFSGNLTGNVTGNLTGNVTGDLTGNVTGGITTSQINVGETFLKPTAIGIGSTTIAGRNAGVGTASGTLSYTADTGLFLYNDNRWVKVAPTVTATGGTKTEQGSRKVHTFTSPGTFIIDGDATANILVVAGGGSGGRGDWTSGSSAEGTGGGGAGGLRYRSSISISPGTYSIEVGTGGAGGTNSDLFDNGGPSFISGISSATGGGVGAWCPATAVAANPDGSPSLYWGRKGGSGGGSAGPGVTGGDSLASPDGISPTAQGFAGGSSNGTNNGGGGGGAGGAGTSNATTANTGGGPGLPYSISGSNYTYAAGGNVNTNGVDGVNYGDGGGGSPFGSTNSGGGADGVVIISWVE